MSMYEMMFGENKDATALLGMIGLVREIFPRYRDAMVNNDGTKILVLTRTGGPNRELYDREIKLVCAHDDYVRDYDDEFDDTYMYFEFNVPNKYKETCMMMKTVHPINMEYKVRKELEDSQIPGSEAEKRMQALADNFTSIIENADQEEPDGSPKIMFM